MKQLFTYILIFISTLLLFNCKKYDEDGKRSWHKPEKRIVGTWYLKEFLVNGIDSVYKWNEIKTSDVTDTISWQLINTRFSFDSERNIDIYISNAHIYNSYYGSANYLHLASKWNLNKSKQELQFETQYAFLKAGETFINFSLLLNANKSWEIKKLTDKEMI